MNTKEFKHLLLAVCDWLSWKQRSLVTRSSRSRPGPTFHYFLPPGMEWQLCPPQTPGLHPPHPTWAHVLPVPQQPQPLCRPPPPPRGPPPLPAHPPVLPPLWPSGASCAHGPPAGLPRRLTPRPPAHLWPLPPGGHRASGHRGHQPAPPAFSHFAPPRPIQAPLSPTFLHCLTCLRQFPPQPHQNKPVPLYVSAPRWPSAHLRTERAADFCL